MHRVILILLMFVAAMSYSQTQPTLYQQGYILGVSLATDCENRYQNQQIYNATSDSSQPYEYLNGLEDGWNLYVNACDGDAIEGPGTSNGGNLIFTGIYIPGLGWFSFFSSPSE